MGQKVHPTGIRLGIVKDWTSTWYADSDKYADYLNMDLQIRDYIKQRLSQASVSRIQISRPAHNAVITVHTARPGIVIGKKGEDIDRLRKEVSDRMGIPVNINIEEIRKPELDANLVAESVAQQLERRCPGHGVCLGVGQRRKQATFLCLQGENRQKAEGNDQQ